MRLGIDDRFWSHVDRSGDCWLWLACKNRRGYGFFGVSGKNRASHRVSWELAHGDIPDGLQVLHRCDNPSCVRPDHLFLGTHIENMADRDTKQRLARGGRIAQAKLSDADVLEIRRLVGSGVPRTEVGPMFGVSYYTIWDITTCRSWKHLPLAPGTRPEDIKRKPMTTAEFIVRRRARAAARYRRMREAMQ